jgi:hypothetical protein
VVLDRDKKNVGKNCGCEVMKNVKWVHYADNKSKKRMAK